MGLYYSSEHNGNSTQRKEKVTEDKLRE